MRRVRAEASRADDMKEIAKDIFRETLGALDVRAALERKLAREGSVVHAAGLAVDLGEYREIVTIALGKASFAMAEALGEILAPEYSCDGILVGPTEPKQRTRRMAGWRTFAGGHPVPDEQSFAAGRAILERLAACDERSLIFFLISGGGSSLVESPLVEGASIEDFQQLNGALVKCGAPIEEINIVRKHVSACKGGRLAAAAPDAMKLTFAASDVPPGMETALASGPTLPDPTTLADAQRVIHENSLWGKIPVAIRGAFERGSLPETPKEGDAAFARAHFSLILGAHDLTHAAHHACEARGYASVCDTETDGWPIEQVADHLLAMLAQQKGAAHGRRAAVVAGGEVSSPVNGDGVGGRNSAFALACVPKIAGKKITVLSAGTDGIDGNSPAAGATADGESLARANAAALDCAEFARRSDAYHFFDRLGDAIVTGPTGNNVRDLRVLLAEPD
jgi:hydroxypyruvate reductase